MSNFSDAFVARLIQDHAREQIRSYQSNLTFAIHVMQNGWLPLPDDSNYQEHIETLRRHLEGIGHSVDDDFLLRFGLTVPGAQRGIVPPLMVLDANRGGFSVRRQKEAAGQILRLLEALAIGRQFLGHLARDTQQAVADLASFANSSSPLGDERGLDDFGKLTTDQAEWLAKRAIELVGDTNEAIAEIGIQILQRLSGLHRSLSEHICDKLIDLRIFWPSSLFRDVGETIAHRILSLVGPSPDLNHILSALAWTRSLAAHQAFREWSSQPPTWISSLHCPPAECATIAGWCIDDHGQRRDLISTQCHRLILNESEAVPQVVCRRSLNQTCPTCNGKVSQLFDFSTVAGRHFSGEFAEAPLRVLCCLNCTCHGPVFSTYRGDDAILLPPANDGHRGELINDHKSCVRSFEPAPFPPFACAEPFSLNDASTLGGIPMWLQSDEFPSCIECERLMTFFAQHDNSPLGEEGIYYAFFCADCHIAAVSYQQT